MQQDCKQNADMGSNSGGTENTGKHILFNNGNFIGRRQ